MLYFYSGLGRWCYDDFFEGSKIILTDPVRETGYFELGGINSDEIEFLKKTTVYYLKPTNEYEKGVEPPFIPNLGELDIPYFELSQPVNITVDDIFKENTQVAEDAGINTQSTKPRKKLKPHERDTNEGLLLVYEIFNCYGVEYLDELPASKAWGKIVSNEFNSDLIKDISGAKKSITLNGGEKLSKIDFSDKYRKRFE